MMLKFLMELLAHSVCVVAVATAPASDLPTSVQCVSPEAQADAGMEFAVGWYDGYVDVVYIQEGLGFEYTQQVLAHELAHALDLAKGTEMNKYPSFFSETHTGFTVEEYARLITYVEGDWPENENLEDHQVIPTQDEIDVMEAADWLR